MDKKLTTEVMHLYADCLRELYSEAGLVMPLEFDASAEAFRIKEAIQQQEYIKDAHLKRSIDLLDRVDGEERNHLKNLIIKYVSKRLV